MSTKDICVSKLNLSEVQYYSLIPSVIVLLILQIYDYWLHKKIRLQPPFLSLSNNDKNKKFVVLGFGAVTGSIVGVLLFGTHDINVDNTIGDVIKNIAIYIVNILVIGIVNYPIFVCISSGKKILPSLLGCLFSLWRFAFVLANGVYIDCSKKPDAKSVTIAYNLVKFLPISICCGGLVVYFGQRLYKCASLSNHVTQVHDVFASKNQIQHVSSIFKEGKFCQTHLSPCIPWYKKPLVVLKNIFNSDFRYSTLFSSTIVMILICYYYLAVGSIYIYTTKFSAWNGNPLTDWTFGVSFIITAVVYMSILVHFLYCHQNTMLSLYRGKNELMKKISTKTLIRNNILFPGYMVAYMVYGMIVFFAVFVAIFVVFYLIVQAVIGSKNLQNYMLLILKYVLSFFFLPMLIYIGQIVLVHFLFTNYKEKVSTIINHIQLYHIVIYFNFFYNIVVGLSSSLKRSFVSLFINLLFMGRIDRSSYVFFSSLDSGYHAYLGFLYVQKIYKNPIMRCFCQILFHDICYKRFSEERNLTEILPHSRSHHRPHTVKSVVAYNRWFLAITLINNPSLICLRGGRNNDIGDSVDDTIDNLLIVNDVDSFSYLRI